MNEGPVIGFGILGTISIQVKVAFCSMMDEDCSDLDELIADRGSDWEAMG